MGFEDSKKLEKVVQLLGQLLIEQVKTRTAIEELIKSGNKESVY